LLICAEDGWVDSWSDGFPNDWNCLGCKKYQTVGIFCLNPDGSVQKVRPILPKLNWLGQLTWKLTNSKREVELDISKLSDFSFDSFKQLVLNAVESDDDVLTQFNSKGKIIEGLAIVENYNELSTFFNKCGWT
jgi:hypothetical protein